MVDTSQAIVDTNEKIDDASEDLDDTNQTIAGTNHTIVDFNASFVGPNQRMVDTRNPKIWRAIDKTRRTKQASLAPANSIDKKKSSRLMPGASLEGVSNAVLRNCYFLLLV